MNYFEQQKQRILVPIIEPEFKLFQVQWKVSLINSMILVEPFFCKAPEAFNAINMAIPKQRIHANETKKIGNNYRQHRRGLLLIRLFGCFERIDRLG